MLYNVRDKLRSPRHTWYDQMKESLSLHVGFMQMFYCIISERVETTDAEFVSLSVCLSDSEDISGGRFQKN